MSSEAWRRNKPPLPTRPSGQSCTRSSCCALLLAQHFIRQARTSCDAHLKVLIRYHLTMSAIFMYLCHLICLAVISSFCSFICFSCPLRACYSVILPLPFHFGFFVWSEMSQGCLITLRVSLSSNWVWSPQPCQRGGGCSQNRHDADS